jgi:hypothetical protein
MDIINNFDQVKTNIEMKYYKNLNKACEKIGLKCEFLKTHQNELITEENNNSVENQITETDIFTEKIDYLYTKPWTKLNQIHKIIKIKEFVNNLEISNNDKEELRDKLIDMLKDKKKKNKINYDEEKGKILTISCLLFKNGKYEINE